MQGFPSKISQKLRAWCRRKPNAADSAGKKILNGLQSTKRDGPEKNAESYASAPSTFSHRSTSSIYDARLLNPALLEPPVATHPDNSTIQDNWVDQGRLQTPVGPVRSPEASISERIDPDRSPQHDSERARPGSHPQETGSSAGAQDDFRDDDSVEWTAEKVQAVREANYITFDGEDETDYTRGPARMVQAADGVVTCTALLLTLDLSKAVQKAL